ncbi:hypothetical protein CYMTET_52540 [Cymbomonas tetramitiformis]|uniref:RanBP-type and C3HC4-type zinc finger-containing protein 1 n=1 Tax=Cymbomonas tetramitiformis TaxID=36881 RepID=A0AAE0EQZ6_9CHLO|nr:hypothetical protein CYMTET_52540 [Cymbomonas tetramitiformis]
MASAVPLVVPELEGDTFSIALRALGKELSCPICLSLLENPVTKLPCNHYFCEECIKQSLRMQPKCPLCKAKFSRREFGSCDKMDKIVAAYKDVLSETGNESFCSQMPCAQQIRAAVATASKNSGMAEGAVVTAARSNVRTPSTATRSSLPSWAGHAVSSQQRQEERLERPLFSLLQTPEDPSASQREARRQSEADEQEPCIQDSQSSGDRMRIGPAWDDDEVNDLDDDDVQPAFATGLRGPLQGKAKPSVPLFSPAGRGAPLSQCDEEDTEEGLQAQPRRVECESPALLLDASGPQVGAAREPSPYLGAAIEIFWALDDAWYGGVVEAVDNTAGTHTVRYNDGEREVVNLMKERYRLMGAGKASSKRPRDSSSPARPACGGQGRKRPRLFAASSGHPAERRAAAEIAANAPPMTAAGRSRSRGGAAASFEEWACGHCTYLNPAKGTRCKICTNRRPLEGSAAKTGLSPETPALGAETSKPFEEASPVPYAPASGASSAGGPAQAPPGKSSLDLEGGAPSKAVRRRSCLPGAPGTAGRRDAAGQALCELCGCGADCTSLGGLARVDAAGVHIKDDCTPDTAAGPSSDAQYVHVQCAEWAPSAYYADNGKLVNVLSEVTRGRKLKCTKCRATGAVLGCRNRRCRKTFHLACARAANCQFYPDSYEMACAEHTADEDLVEAEATLLQGHCSPPIRCRLAAGVADPSDQAVTNEHGMETGSEAAAERGASAHTGKCAAEPPAPAHAKAARAAGCAPPNPNQWLSHCEGM